MAIGFTVAALLGGWPLLGRAQDTLRWVTNYYAVTGASFPEIMESIDRSRPPQLAAPLTGLTAWHLRWHMHASPSPHGYRCTAFSTQLTMTNTLPYWKAPTNATLWIKDEWHRYFAKLATHEAGHSQIALAALAEIHRQARDFKEAPDFESLRGQIDAAVEGVLDRYRKIEVDYDLRTEHGTRPYAAAGRDLGRPPP